MDAPGADTTTDVELISPPLARLTDGAATIRRLLAARWPDMAEALLGGATLGQVATATGLEPSELRAGFTRWASDQARAGRLDVDQHSTLVNLVFGVTS